MTTHDLRPVAEPFTPEVAAILADYPQRNGYILELFRVFANSLRFLKKGTLNLLDRDSPLPMRERELVILRVCAANGCEYEWGVHVGAFADHVGLSETQIRATRLGRPDDACWTSREQTLLSVIDELCSAGTVGDTTLQALQAGWTTEQQLEIFALCGNYHTISFVANAARLTPEPFAARFPAG